MGTCQLITYQYREGKYFVVQSGGEKRVRGGGGGRDLSCYIFILYYKCHSCLLIHISEDFCFVSFLAHLST